MYIYISIFNMQIKPKCHEKKQTIKLEHKGKGMKRKLKREN